MKLTLYISFFVLTHFCAHSQVYLNDTSVFNSLWCSYNGVYESDSGFFVMGSLSRVNYNGDLAVAIAHFSNNGDKTLVLDDFDPTSNQKNYGSIHKMFKNNNDNFIFLYNNCESGVGCYPRLKEVSSDGSVLTDTSLQSIILSANLFMLDFNNIIQKADRSYLISLNVDDTMRTNAPFMDGNGFFTIHLDSNFNLLDSTRFFTSGASINRGYGSPQITEVISNKNIVLMVSELKQASPDSLEEAQIVFITLDSNSNIIGTSYYSDGQKSVSPLGLTQTNDGGYLFTYLRGEWNAEINGWEYYRYLCKVDGNFSLIWKKLTSDNVGIGAYYLDKEIQPTLDNNFVVVGGAYEDSSIYEQRFAQIIKFNDSGDFIWKRQHYKIKDTSEIYPIEVEINDVIATSDSGYCMVGRVYDWTAIGLGNPSNFGYLVKTNCLGFLGNAVASVSFNATNLDATFYNTSMQAGSYYWDFGDGTTLATDEYADTVSHTYAPSSSSASGGGEDYDVTLIAYGCYDSLGVRDADTLQFTVTITEDGSSVVVTDNGYFVLFPNPSSAGVELSIYLNELDPSNGAVSLSFYAMDGRLVKKALLSANEGTYMLDNNLARGMYEVVLVQGGKVLQGEKLMVY